MEATGSADVAGVGESTNFTSGVVSLTEFGLLKVHGADAATFLQAQLTNDVASLADGEVRLAGYCSVKGRLMASFWVWRESAAQTFWLACSRDIAAAIARRLAMFVLRAKAKVEDVSDAVALLGIIAVHGETGAPAIQADALSLPDVALSEAIACAIEPARLETGTELRIARALLPVPADACDDRLRAMHGAGTRVLPMQAWRRLEVLSGIARIEAASQEQFVPQMVNFELVDGVNFRKGCYPGQEVVARSQYLGKLKRRAFLGLGVGAAPASGSDVFAPGAGSTEPVGQVVLAAPLADGNRFVVFFESTIGAVAPTAGAGETPEAGAADARDARPQAPAGGQPAEPAIRIGDSPISRLPLPYSLPTATAAPTRRVPDATA
jgi:folate-binding protein YgfZ